MRIESCDGSIIHYLMVAAPALEVFMVQGLPSHQLQVAIAKFLVILVMNNDRSRCHLSKPGNRLAMKSTNCLSGLDYDNNNLKQRDKCMDNTKNDW